MEGRACREAGIVFLEWANLSEALRRKNNRGLNKGEAINALASVLNININAISV